MVRWLSNLAEAHVRLATRLSAEFAGYLLVSVAALVVDMSLLWVLTSFVQSNYLMASAASYCVGAVFHYLLSVSFVFTQRRVANRRAEFVMFLLIGLLGLLATQLVLHFAHDVAGLSVMQGKIIAVGVSFALTFSVRKLVLFTGVGAAEKVKALD